MGNWFIAIPVDPGDWHARLPPPPLGSRAFVGADLHLTIAFLGAVGPERAQAAWEALRWPLAAREVSLEEVVPMGPPDRFSALSALLGEGRAEIEQAMSSARDAPCDAAGAPRERRPAKAHVTLARPRRRATADERARALAWAAGLDVREVRLRLDRVALYAWSVERAERLFRVVHERALDTA